MDRLLDADQSIPWCASLSESVIGLQSDLFRRFKKNKSEKDRHSVSSTIQRIVYSPEDELLSSPDLQEHQGRKLESPQAYGENRGKCYAEE
jgi:hypothetical protein